MNKGQFQTGRTKTGGRKKGTQNKSTLLFKEQLHNYFFDDKGLQSLFSDIEQLELKDKVLAKLKLLSYAMPKLKALEIDIDTSCPRCDEISNMTEEELNAELKRLRKDLKEYDE